MRQKLAAGFWILAIVAALVWVVGLIAGVVIPVSGGIRAEALGGVLFSIALGAEVLLYVFGWISQKSK
jgi:hypothetical protein